MCKVSDLNIEICLFVITEYATFFIFLFFSARQNIIATTWTTSPSPRLKPVCWDLLVFPQSQEDLSCGAGTGETSGRPIFRRKSTFYTAYFIFFFFFFYPHQRRPDKSRLSASDKLLRPHLICPLSRRDGAAAAAADGGINPRITARFHCYRLFIWLFKRLGYQRMKYTYIFLKEKPCLRVSHVCDKATKRLHSSGRGPEQISGCHGNQAGTPSAASWQANNKRANTHRSRPHEACFGDTRRGEDRFLFRLIAPDWAQRG